MKIVISSGHGLRIRGARGDPVPPQLDEVETARAIVNRCADLFREAGIECVVWHDDVSTTQSANLDWIVDHHNDTDTHHDYDVSVHMNCYDHSAHGIEVLYLTEEALAADLSAAIAGAGGFTNRGAKHRGDLAFLNGTREAAVLLEVAFCDNTSDCQKLVSNFEGVCEAIVGVFAEMADLAPPPTEPDRPEHEQRPERVPVDQRPTLRQGDEGDDVLDMQR